MDSYATFFDVEVLKCCFFKFKEDFEAWFTHAIAAYKYSNSEVIWHLFKDYEVLNITLLFFFAISILTIFEK